MKIRLFAYILLVITFFTVSLSADHRAGVVAKSVESWSATPVFEEQFESLADITANGGVYSGISIVSGWDGNGALINQGDTLYYPNSIDPQKGTIRFWLSPTWAGDTTSEPHYFLGWHQNDARFRIFTWHSSENSKNYFVFRYNDGNGTDYEVSTSSDEPDVVMQWQPNEWHDIIAFWDFTVSDQFFGLAIDGVVYTNNEENWTITETPTQFWVGSNSYGDYQADAVMDDLRIYDESIWDPDDLISSYENITCGNGVWDHHETIHNCPSDAPTLASSIHPGEDILFYETAPFEAVYEGTAPSAEAITDTIHYRAAQDEYETLFFNAYTRTDLQNVVVNMSDFVGPGGVISASNAQLRVVHNWWQAGTGPLKDDFPHYTPELLLFDDGIDLEGQTWDYNTLPAMPHLDHVETALQSFTSKQFAMILNVPEATASGHYTATITLAPDNHASKTLLLDLEVLPFELRDTGKTVVVYHPANIDNTGSQYYVPMDRYDAQLADIRAHNFNGTDIYGHYPDDNIPLKVQKNREAGLTLRAVLNEYYDDGVALLQSNGYEPYFYGIDEPMRDNGAYMDDQISLSITIHNGGGLVTTAITREGEQELKDCNSTYYDGFPPGTCEPLDMANLAVSQSSSYLNGLIDGTETKEDYETYYWQIMQENPKINRFQAGFYLWNTGIDGIFPYVYQDVRNNPYDDFDVWSSSHPYRDHLVTYPSQNGPVPTVQWEALREGLDDMRYLQTWQYYKTLAGSVDSAAAQASEQTIAGALAHYDNYDKMMTTPMAQYTEDRDVVIGEIEAMKTIVEATITPPTITISQSGDSLVLNWHYEEPFDAYQVWRSESPHFEPGDENAILLDTLIAPTSTYTDTPPPTIIGDTTINYTYRLLGVIDDVDYGLSNLSGEFDFALIAGN